MSRTFEVDVDGVSVACRLPLMPTRLALVNAASAADHAPDDEREFVQPLAFYAALGACMATPPACGSLGHHRGSVTAYGEAVADELCDGDPARLPGLVRAGAACLRAIIASLPTQAEVEDAKRPTSAPAGTSTGATSESA